MAAPGDCWHAWHRPRRGERWQRLVTRATEGACLQAALAMMKSGDWLFRQGGEKPNKDKQTRGLR
jgi:hypothetical protein